MEVARELPPWLRTTVDWAFALAGLAGGLAGLVKAAGGLSRALLPCAAKFIAGFGVGEAVGRYVVGPVINRAMSGLFGRPVEVATGRKILPSQGETDFIVNSPIPIVCARFYASSLADASTLGRGWLLPWDLRLQARDGQLWYTDGEGRESGFPLVPPGHTAFSEAEQCYLACTLDGQYILYDLNEAYYDFGRVDVAGSEVAWVQRVEDRSGQWQSYHRDEHDRVQTIRTSGGQQLRLHYDGLPARLVEIECTHGGSPGPLVRYGYDANHQLSSVTDANGAVTRRFSYEQGLMASHTNALGLVSSYTWAEIEGTMRVVACASSEGERTEFRYDPAQRQAWARDEQGRSAHWRWDEHFQIIESTDLDESRYRIAYNDAGQPVQIDLPGERSLAFEYDEAGRIVAETDPLGRVTRTSYDGNSLRVRQLTLPDGRRWTANYDYLGRLLATSDAIGREESYEYGPGLSPLPLVHVDARGGRQQMQWNARGLLTALTDCSGKTTRFQYNQDGRLAARIDALGQELRYECDRMGRVESFILADGSAQHVRYDAAGLPVEQRNDSGSGKVARQWLRNARGQVLESVDPAGRRLRYRYDAQGRLTELDSGSSASYRFSYDSADRLVLERRPDGIERHLHYHVSGQPSAIDKRGTGDVGGAQRRLTHFERDKIGRLLAQHTEHASTVFTWNEINQLAEATREPTEAGLAIGLTPNTVRFEYDQAGRMRAEHGADGSVGYTFDELDNLLALALPHGQDISMLNYGSGHVHQISSAGHLIADVERDDLHREVQRSQGALTQHIGYDALGRRAWQSAGLVGQPAGPAQGRLWRSYRYQPAGMLAEQRDSVRGPLAWQYDEAGRMQQQTGAAVPDAEQFAWDAAGNLLDDLQHKSRGKVEGNRLKVWQDLRFDYDAWGNVLTKKKGAHQVQHFQFDAEDRLLSVVTDSPLGRIETRFEYDAVGRRIGSSEIRHSAAGAIITDSKRFVWQGLRMVQEVRQGSVSSYVYSPDAVWTPLARVDALIGSAMASAAIDTARASSRVYHFHTDLIGMPLEVTDEAGELAWAGKHTAWGKVSEDDPAARQIEQPLRYPGQYADHATGLHYNTFRYYDPDIGRFISQDPIGLGGGDNLYAYAPNPTTWADPLGWCSTTLGRNMGARSGDGMANHHLIPEELLKSPTFRDMFDRLRGMGFDGDGAGNGTFLPGSSQLAQDMGIPGHWSNHPQFTSQIEAELARLNRRFLSGQLSDMQLILGVREIQNAAREGLDAGRYAIDAVTGRLL